MRLDSVWCDGVCEDVECVTIHLNFNQLFRVDELGSEFVREELSWINCVLGEHTAQGFTHSSLKLYTNHSWVFAEEMSDDSHEKRVVTPHS